MIRCNLSTLMGKNKMNIQDVCDKTGLARNTVSFLYHDKVKRVDYATANSLCMLFNCGMGDLFEYVSDEDENAQ